MGYMSIDIGGSDTAADLDYDVELKLRDIGQEAAIDRMRKEFEANHSVYNTHGCVNVALVLTEGGHNFEAMPNYRALVKDTIIAMEGLLREAQDAEWQDEDNKKEHVDRYKELIMALAEINK